MTRVIVLDTGVLGLLAHPRNSPETEACRQWATTLSQAGDRLIIPEIVDYELRREYLRRGSIRGLRILDALQQQARYVPLTTPGMRRAAELWAWARNRGHIIAPEHDINADVILAAQAQLLVEPDVTVLIATTNVRHLAPFITARLWRQI